MPGASLTHGLFVYKERHNSLLQEVQTQKSAEWRFFIATFFIVT